MSDDNTVTVTPINGEVSDFGHIQHAYTVGNHDEANPAPPPGPAAGLASCQRALRLLGVAMTTPEYFTHEHLDQLVRDVEHAAATIKAVMDTPETDTSEPSDLLDIINRLPSGGRIILERGCTK